MSHQKTTTITSTSAGDTERLAEGLGSRLNGGECIELVSDLGGGKTTFTRGLVKGAGSLDSVASPTFTISRVYKSPKFDIHHFDFYRLQDAGLAAYELEDLLGDPKIVIVVEWGGVVERVLPDDKLTIEIAQKSNGHRELQFTASADLKYLLEDIC